MRSQSRAVCEPPRNRGTVAGDTAVKRRSTDAPCGLSAGVISLERRWCQPARSAQRRPARWTWPARVPWDGAVTLDHLGPRVRRRPASRSHRPRRPRSTRRRRATECGGSPRKKGDRPRAGVGRRLGPEDDPRRRDHRRAAPGGAGARQWRPTAQRCAARRCSSAASRPAAAGGALARSFESQFSARSDVP